MRFFCMPFFACNPQVDSIDKRQCNLQAIPINDLERYSRSLEELLLDMNHLKDLPKALFRLQKLRRLGLSDNDIHRLPPDVGALQGLVDLNISRNDISDIPDELKNCRQLLILDISSNPIARLPDSITLLSSLTHLALNDTSLTRLPPDIGRLVGLQSLELRENHLRSLPSTIRQLVRLQRLDLGQNELDELPPEIGELKSLMEFYLDENSIETLPDSLLNCKALEQFDICSNRLNPLPDQFGELDRITDLTLSHNFLDSIPNSIGRLKRVNIIKVDGNTLTRLTPAIGSCTMLTELFLMQNLLSEIPSTIGHLTHLSNLNLDRNQIAEVPPLIGNCTNLTVLSLRGNNIEELPLEIGKLSNLRVLDVSNNRLTHLPYTVQVLNNLQALWLSENQSQAMVRLTQNTDPKTNIRVLTCYLLPQQSANVQEPLANKVLSSKNAEFVGGPKVHFGDTELDEPEDALKLTGNFERKDTPHPKPNVPNSKLKKQLVDGHVIQHDEKRPSVVSLTKKSSTTEIPETLPRTQQQNGPKSSLKHPPIYNRPGSSTEDASFVTAPSTTSIQKEVVRDNNSSSEIKRIIIRREPNVGLGMSVAGGVESTITFIDNDHGLFISKLAASGPADRAGLRVGDKILEVNGTSMVDQRHEMAVKCMQQNASAVELLIQRGLFNPNASPLQRNAKQTSIRDLNHVPITPTEPPSRQGPFVVESAPSNNNADTSTSAEIVSTTIIREPGQPLGMSMLHTSEVAPNKSPLRIQFIAPDGPVSRDGKLRVGDEVVSINGVNLKGMRFDDALILLQNARSDGPRSELHLVVQRTTPIADSKQRTLHAGELPYGDKRLDGLVEEVELARDSNNSLGLSIVGGVDHACHPFAIQEPGVFISKISSNSAASRSRRLRVGDRILAVNGRDIAKAKHAEAVEALKNSGKILRLTVCHEPQPRGLQEVYIKRRPNQPLGLVIVGGIGGSPANPSDPTDEGIFIVEANSPASEAGAALKAGTRILEVNEDSLLGCSKTEAADLLRKATGNVRLLVCEGFHANNEMANSRDELQTEFSLGSSSMTLPSFSASASTLPQLNNPSTQQQSLADQTFTTTTPTTFIPLQHPAPPNPSRQANSTAFDASAPLGRSSPVQSPNPIQHSTTTIQHAQLKPTPPPRSNEPTQIHATSSSISKPISNIPSPPSVTIFSAAKPSVDQANTSTQSTTIDPPMDPENLTFSSKVKRFENSLDLGKTYTEKLLEQRQRVENPSYNPNRSSTSPINNKLPTVSDQDLKFVKESLLKTGENPKPSFAENENRSQQTRTIPVKIQSTSEQNGKSTFNNNNNNGTTESSQKNWRDLHNEAYRIEPLTSTIADSGFQRSSSTSIRNGDHTRGGYSSYTTTYGSKNMLGGSKPQDANNHLTGVKFADE